MPKYELILVYPGIGQTKPLGLKLMISELIVLELGNEFVLIIGIKNIEKNIIIKIVINIEILNVL